MVSTSLPPNRGPHPGDATPKSNAGEDRHTRVDSSLNYERGGAAEGVLTTRRRPSSSRLAGVEARGRGSLEPRCGLGPSLACLAPTVARELVPRVARPNRPPSRLATPDINSNANIRAGTSLYRANPTQERPPSAWRATPSWSTRPRPAGPHSRVAPDFDPIC